MDAQPLAKNSYAHLLISIGIGDWQDTAKLASPDVALVYFD
jgi:hypothetical protein